MGTVLMPSKDFVTLELGSMYCEVAKKSLMLDLYQ